MEIEEIKKINVQDGDIICFPLTTPEMLESVSRNLRQVFPEKRFIVFSVDKETLAGIKVVHID